MHVVTSYQKFYVKPVSWHFRVVFFFLLLIHLAISLKQMKDIYNVYVIVFVLTVPFYFLFKQVILV